MLQSLRYGSTSSAANRARRVWGIGVESWVPGFTLT